MNDIAVSLFFAVAGVLLAFQAHRLPASGLAAFLLPLVPAAAVWSAMGRS